MIERRTVFILGAGASEPYGFPTGPQLAGNIAVSFAPCGMPGTLFRNSPLSQELLGTFAAPGVSPDLIQVFPNAFRESCCSTLDEFVQAPGNRRFLELVKGAMVCELVKREDPAKLFPVPAADWCKYLFSTMRTPAPEGFQRNQLKVITFNFDRSFEYRLFLMLRGAYGVSDDEAGRLTAAVPVHHVHGQLGGPRWLGEGRADARDYAVGASAEQKRELLDNVKLVHEELPDRDLEAPREWIRQAERIVFIGFGYHPLLLCRLGITKENLPAAAIIGSVYGFTKREQYRIGLLFPDRAKHISYDMKALEFLRNAPIL